jgi:predicted DNA-binding transcriptional regulator AlpA
LSQGFAGEKTMVLQSNPLCPVPELPELPVRLFKVESVCKMLAISRATLYRKIKDGHFPKPIMLDVRQPRWTQAQLLAYLADISVR